MNISFGRDKFNNKRFADLCGQLVLAEFPDAEILDGSGGDSGKDALYRSISGEKTIFQFKYFPERLKSAQRQQIKRSLKRVSCIAPEKWVLMVPLDFTPDELRWFESLSALYPTIRLDHWTMSKLISRILKHPHIRDAFFPPLNLEIKQFMHLLKKQDKLPANPSQEIISEISELRDLLQGDPNYKIEFRTEEKATIFSVHPRYPHADTPPIRIGTRLKVPNTSKGKRLLRTLDDLTKKGTSTDIVIPGEYIDKLAISLKLPFGIDECRVSEMRISAQEQITCPPWKLELFPLSGEPCSIDYLAMKRVRTGTEEIEVSNVDQDIPLKARFVFTNPLKTVTLFLVMQYKGYRPLQLLRYSKFLRALQKGGSLRISLLESGESCFSLHMKNIDIDVGSDEWLDALKSLISVEQKTGVRLIFPEKLTEDDIRAVWELKSINETGRATLPVEKISISPTIETAKRFLEVHKSDDYKFGQIKYDESATSLFGVTMPLGPCIYSFEATPVQSNLEVRNAIEAIPPDGIIKIDFKLKDDKLFAEYTNWIPA